MPTRHCGIHSKLVLHVLFSVFSRPAFWAILDLHVHASDIAVQIACFLDAYVYLLLSSRDAAAAARAGVSSTAQRARPTNVAARERTKERKTEFKIKKKKRENTAPPEELKHGIVAESVLLYGPWR
ncbi:hypothetical protein F5Y14DRAFT_400353 [Nemania sp. NC0429]|nr:hypothetical protein F5Y14DRAFT_400353 [Nemania sp. NC0429]